MHDQSDTTAWFQSATDCAYMSKLEQPWAARYHTWLAIKLVLKRMDSFCSVFLFFK